MQEFPSKFNGKTFENPVPTEVSGKGAMFKILKEYLKKNPDKKPAVTPGPFHVDLNLFKSVPSNDVRVTWLGHSSLILEVDGKRFLTDPVYYQRVSPFTMIGPKRFFDVPVKLEELPHIDFILLSHDHYDHLDKGTIKYLTSKGIRVITMLGVGERLMSWGIKKSLITELNWWQDVIIDNNFVITGCPARHFSGRTLKDRFKTLWGSFAIKGPNHNVYFGADSGYYPGFTTIGNQLGPFDLTLLDTGAYNEHWASIHMGPENAVQANIDLKGKLLMPIHWGTFSLALHPWTEPVERVIKEAKKKDVPLLIPAPGETRSIADGAYNSNWWKKF
jgi:L-ascorbate metabolism protein UlaG (beta-lactamase superfamily)